MLVVKAAHAGMCFGVRDAVAAARLHPDPSQVTIHGELVHNETVLAEMAKRGFRQVDEHSREPVPETPEVLITAHGVSERERERLRQAGKKLVDTTCPLVTRAHKAALRLNRLGYFVVVVGRHGHVEVEGLVGDLDRFTVVNSPDEVRSWDQAHIGVINQTTTGPDLLETIHARIRALNPDRKIEFVDTICKPTRDRQVAIDELVDRVEAVVVVGGKNSNNTRQLGLVAQRRGKPWWHIQSADQLQSEWFDGLRVVGLTAGTSTPDETIDEVYRRLLSIAALQKIPA